jgi:hypothetical protein
VRLTDEDIERRRAKDEFFRWHQKVGLNSALVGSPLIVIPFALVFVASDGLSCLSAAFVAMAVGSVLLAVSAWRGKLRAGSGPPWPSGRRSV